MAEKVKCTIVSGAPNDCADFLKENIDRESFIIAADSGYKKLLAAGIMPDLIIADFDSSEKPENLGCEIITFPSEKSYTDTFNCVIYAVQNGFIEIEIFNAVGSRFDHTYGNVLCLEYCRQNGVKCTVVDEHNRLRLIEKEYTFKADYKYFSLFAFLSDCKGVRIKGAKYGADWYNKESLSIKMGEQTALCNCVSDGECTVTLESGVLLLCESND